jgi:multidrug efflux pump
MIKLSNLLVVRESVSPKNLNHFNRIRAATITATLAPGYPLGDALDAMNAAAKKVLPPTVQTDLNGLSREFRDSSTEIYFVFLLALAFIFLVLAAQFESFIDPFIIMLTGAARGDGGARRALDGRRHAQHLQQDRAR